MSKKVFMHCAKIFMSFAIIANLLFMTALSNQPVKAEDTVSNVQVQTNDTSTGNIEDSSVSAKSLLSEPSYSFDVTNDEGYILVERYWGINVWDDLGEPSSVKELSTSKIPSYSALKVSSSAYATVDKDTYLSLTIGSRTGTFTITGQRYKISNDDGSYSYATWDQDPSGKEYVVEECQWKIKVGSHVYETEGTVIKEPTCIETGTMSYECKLCHNATKEEKIPSLHAQLGEGERCPECGEVLFTWDEETKTLAFHSDIPDFFQDNYTTRPYQEYADRAEKIVIGEEVDQIGKYAFANFSVLNTVGPQGTEEQTGLIDVNRIGLAAFWNVKGIHEYTFTENVKDIDGALYNCGELENVIMYTTSSTDAFGFQPNDVISGSTIVKNMLIDDLDGVVGKENMSSNWDGIINLTLNVREVTGGATSDDLVTFTVTNADSVADYVFYDLMWGGNVFPSLKEIALVNVAWVGEYAFGNTSVENVTLKNVGTMEEGAFYQCANLSQVTIDNVGLIDAYSFDGCTSLDSLDIPEETKLGYSNIFDFDDPNFAYLKDRMFNILEGKFVLDENPAPEEISVSNDWEDYRMGNMNAAQLDETQVSKAARWADDAKTTADVEFQFNYAKTQGMDFIFVVDYSGSMSKVGNHDEGTIADETVDENSRFFDMQSKLLDVSEELLNTEGYDNRVAFVTFATTSTSDNILDFTKDYDSVESFVLADQPYGSTNYSKALSNAKDLIESRDDTSREAAVIFISDGKPNRFVNGDSLKTSGNTNTWDQLLAQISSFAQDIKDLQQFAHETKIFGVLQSVPENEKDSARQVLEDICTESLFFESTNTESFSEAINNAIGATYQVYTLTDEIDPAFTLDENSIQVSSGFYTIGKNNENGNTTITWTITGVPYLTQTMSYQLDLIPDENETYPEGTFDTNEGNAIILLDEQLVNEVETPILTRGTLLLQPADMTIYMGGDDGYSGVVGDAGEITENGSTSLPEPGYYVTLSAEIDAAIKEAWKDSEDISAIEDSQGNTIYVMNLSDYLRLKDTKDGREWTLSLYSSSYSLAYSKYIYRIESVNEGQDPIRLQFVDQDGNCHENDEFILSDSLYQTYTMQIYNEAVNAGDVKAELRIDNDHWISLPLSLDSGELKVRYVTGSQDSTVTSAITDINEVSDINKPLQHAYAIISNTTHFYINNSMIPVDDANISLLFDDVVSDSIEGSLADYSTILGNIAISEIGETFEDPLYQAKYLDIVDADNGNVWLTPSEEITVYWPYPEGTDENTKFYLLHFEGLNREMEQEEIEDLLLSANVKAINVETDPYGISFQTDSFSPFVLVWDNSKTNLPDTSNPDETVSKDPGTATKNDFAVWGYIALFGALGIYTTRRIQRKG